MPIPNVVEVHGIRCDYQGCVNYFSYEESDPVPLEVGSVALNQPHTASSYDFTFKTHNASVIVLSEEKDLRENRRLAIKTMKDLLREKLDNFSEAEDMIDAVLSKAESA